MFLLSSLKQSFLNPKDYFASEAKKANLPTSLLNVFAALAAVVVPFLLMSWLNNAYFFYTDFMFFILLFFLPLIPFAPLLLGSYALCCLFGGRGSFVAHLNVWALVLRNGALVGWALTLVVVPIIAWVTSQGGDFGLFFLSLFILQPVFLLGLLFLAAFALDAVHGIGRLKTGAALAIPAVLLGFLWIMMNVFAPICCSPLDAGVIFKSELESIVSAGYGVSSPKKVEFVKDQLFNIKSVIGDAPLADEDVVFLCGAMSPGLCSDPDAPLTVDPQPGTGSIVVNKKTDAYVVVCGDDTRKSNPKYCISVARQGSDARTTCVNRCLNNDAIEPTALPLEPIETIDPVPSPTEYPLPPPPQPVEVIEPNPNTTEPPLPPLSEWS